MFINTRPLRIMLFGLMLIVAGGSTDTWYGRLAIVVGLLLGFIGIIVSDFPLTLFNAPTVVDTEPDVLDVEPEPSSRVRSRRNRPRR